MRVLICIFALAFVAATKAQTTVVPDPTPSTDFDCPDREEAFYSHPTDCSAFYHCTNGLAWYMRCEGELYFNPITTLCDWPWNVDCVPGSTVAPPEPTTEDPALRGVSMIDPSPEYKCDPEVNGAFQHDEFCELYYDCYNGQATLFTCTDIQLFDLVYDGCNWAQDVDCGNRTRPEGYPTTKQPPVTDVTDDGSTYVCPSPDGLFEDPEDCAGYYQCYAGQSWHHQCSIYLYFNPINEVCDYLSAVDCGDRPIHDKRVFMDDAVMRMLKAQ